MINTYRIDAPEAVSITYRVAGIGNRFLATVIDSLVMLAGGIVIVLGTFALGLAFPVLRDVATILESTLAFVLVFGYYVVFETLWSGRTPGKRWMHLRVLKTSGYPIGFVNALIRNLVRIVDFLPTSYAIGVIVMFISPQSRRLGDYAAGTVVVKESGPVGLNDLTVPVPVARTVAPGAIDPEELDWNLDVLTVNEVSLITELLSRLPTLTLPAGQKLARQIADRIAGEIGAREPNDAAQFLRRVLELHATQTEQWVTPRRD